MEDVKLPESEWNLMYIPEIPFTDGHNDAMEMIRRVAADTWHNAIKA
jgi:hypothetical protein